MAAPRPDLSQDEYSTLTITSLLKQGRGFWNFHKLQGCPGCQTSVWLSHRRAVASCLPSGALLSRREACLRKGDHRAPLKKDASAAKCRYNISTMCLHYVYSMSTICLQSVYIYNHYIIYCRYNTSLLPPPEIGVLVPPQAR